jgi:hypothetical protein
MTPEQKKLYERIDRFQIDRSDANIPFSAKLAWDYRWSSLFVHRVIQEYKKFMFLVVVANQPLSPSTAIDRAWHYHLLYTQSYWEDFCGKVLQRPIQHIPSLGGYDEGVKFYQQYCETLALYRSYFGSPPEDIWNNPRLKSEHPACQWIDRSQYWMLPKPRLSRLVRQP